MPTKAAKSEEHSKPSTKINKLKQIEGEMHSIWDLSSRNQSNYSSTSKTPTYMTTFPYPYMNGFLHLGHLFTISKSDFAIGYNQILGKSVLFPFSFHCTGMPIVATSVKLSREIESNKSRQIRDNLISFGIPEEDIQKFTDPIYWTKYFPPYAMKHIKEFGGRVDWRRSFITTDLNPHYDSFVKWQFRKLKSLGYILYGKRPTIYSVMDNAPCLDHDRQSGEGVCAKEIQYLNLDCGLYDSSPVSISCTIDPDMDLSKNSIKTILINPDDSYVIVVDKNDQKCIMSCLAANNMKHQEKLNNGIPPIDISTDKIVEICKDRPYSVVKMNSSDINKNNTGILLKLAEAKETSAPYTINAFHIPETEVISRTDDICIVALCEQWFIDYGNKEWKERVRNHVKKMEFYTQETRNGIEKAVEWLHEWPCTRRFGLGTKLPWDETWIIDSLSDSTLYMAYYTVSHIIQKDYTPEELTDDLWDYIFIGKNSNTFDKTKHKELRDSFTYFYPVNMRVSGKDLVPNHLTFYIFNHVALLDSSFWPLSIRANGHLLLNSEKMSKSTGNFLTVHDAVQEYSSDPVRITLADAGDGLDDANFNTDLANKTILRVYTYLEQVDLLVQELETGDMRDGVDTDNYTDSVFYSTLVENIYKSVNGYSKTEYREALLYSYFEMQNAKDEYIENIRNCSADRCDGRLNKDLIRWFLRLQCILLFPIAPHFTEYIWNEKLKEKNSILEVNKNDETCSESGLIKSLVSLIEGSWNHVNTSFVLFQKKYLESIFSDFKKTISKTKNKKEAVFHIEVSEGFNQDEKEIIEIVYKAYDEQESHDDKILTRKIVGSMKSRMKYVQFAMEVKKSAVSGGLSFLSSNRPFDEVRFINENKNYISSTLKINISEVYAKGDVDMKAKGKSSKPGSPVLKEQPPLADRSS